MEDESSNASPQKTLVVYSGPTSMDRLQDKNGMYKDNMVRYDTTFLVGITILGVCLILRDSSSSSSPLLDLLTRTIFSSTGYPALMTSLTKITQERLLSTIYLC
jgi:hypothetical protein